MSSRGPRNQGFYGHDDRVGDRGGNRGRGGQRGGGRMGNRGGFGAPILKRYNRQKFGGGSGGQPGYGRREGGNRARFADEDGDIEMQGGNLPDHMRNRFKPYNSYNRNRKRRGMPDRRGGRDVYIPPHLQNKSSEGTWYKVVVPHGKKLGKDFILREIKARMSIPLIPYNFQFDGHNAVFYVNDVATAAAVRNLNKVIDTSSGFKMTIITKGSDLPIVTIDDDTLSSLKLVMSKRYDATRGHLDLANFQKDESLKELNLYIAFTRPSILSVAVKIIVENVPEVQTLDLSNNKLATLYPLSPIHGACKQLRSLNLANNRIMKMAELDSMKGMSSVQELILEGNPVCTAYNEKSEYISAVRQRFPKVILLDHNELPPPISFDLGLEETIPSSKPSYFPSEDVKQIVVQFLEQYFTIFDSKDRSGLLDAYHDNAIFSMSSTKLPQTKTDAREFTRDSRNIIKVTNVESRREKLKTGRVNIVSLLNQMPETRHDPSSFTVDIPLVTPTLMCFTVFGILRVVSKGLIVPSVKSFTRTFFVVPQGAGFSIINETLFITGGTEDQIRAYPTPENTPPTPAPVPAPAAATSERDGLVVQLCSQTRMNRAFAERCLEQNDWNLQKAITVFTELSVRGAIPPEAFQS
ncbi:nuclear RNA export factor 1-like [Dermacentor silvarum]|uniref:nuclear RNA export factor 1-like n=1 Tax=Dermacentor silvarum TaxID=543639 RepID=UPI00189A039C|nr:nuclear RNA export factor 1-like [Dermacentor silvarum]